MKENEKRYRSLIEASQDLLVTVNLAGAVSDANEAAVKITGVDRGALMGSNFFQYFTEPDLVRALYREIVAGGP